MGKRVPPSVWVAGMLASGAASSVLGKAMYSVKSKGTDGTHYFKKPWMETLLMFVAMTSCVFVYFGTLLYRTGKRLQAKALQKGQVRDAEAINHPLIEPDATETQDTGFEVPVSDVFQLTGADEEHDNIGDSPSPAEPEPAVDDVSSRENLVRKKKKKKKEVKPPMTTKRMIKLIFLIAIPSMCDMIATVMMSIGLLWCTASVWQMLRGSILVFTALISIVWLRRKLHGYHYIGVILCTIALIMVGASSLLTAYYVKSDDDDASSSNQATGTVYQQCIGISLITAAQFVQALQTVIEEVLLKGMDADEVLIVGMEGGWGMAVMICLLCPILYFIPGNDAGSVENSLDSVVMFFHSWTLVAVILAYMFVILWYNLTGMFITSVLTAIHRNILEAVRTLCVWTVDLLLYYLLTDGSFGEPWTRFSWLELAGFVVLMTGTFIYNRVIKIPGFSYETAENYGL